MSLTMAIELTVEMRRKRDQLRERMGDRYRPMVDALIGAVRSVAQHTGREPFEVATSDAAKAGNIGQDMSAWQLIAAACEIAEAEES